MNNFNSMTNQINEATEISQNNPLFNSKLNNFNQSEIPISSNEYKNQSDNFTQNAERAKSFLSIPSNMEKINLTDPQTLTGLINNSNYIQIPLNTLLTQYQNQNSSQENKNPFLTNFNSVSQNHILGPVNSTNFSEAEVNEMFKIQEKLRKFPQLFNKVFEKKFNLGFPAFTKCEDNISVEEKNAKAKKNLHSTAENKIYLELKEKLTQTDQRARDLAAGQKEAYMKFCYLVLRIKEKSLQARNCSYLLSDKLEFYASLNEKLFKSVEELNQIFRFNSVNCLADQLNRFGSSETQEEKEIEIDIFLKPEFESYLEILKNFKMGGNLKENFIISNQKLNEALDKLNNIIDERILFLENEVLEKQKLNIIYDKKTTTIIPNNNKIKITENVFIEDVLKKINDIMNEVNINFQALIEKEKTEEQLNFSTENPKAECNQKLDLSIKKNDIELNHLDPYNSKVESNEDLKKFKNSKYLEKIINRKPTMIKKEISNYFTHKLDRNKKGDIEAFTFKTMNRHSNNSRFGNDFLGFFS